MRPPFEKSFIPGSVCLLAFVVLSIYTTLLFAAEGNTAGGEPKAEYVGQSLDDFDPQQKSDHDPGVTTGSKGSKIFPVVWCVDIDDEVTKSLCWKAYRNGLNYYEFGLSHRQNVLEWQHISTKIILFVVLTLVGMGLYFAWVQFQKGETLNTDNKIELSANGLKISSPVLGVIILALSLGFFYLYLVHVYPITETI